MQQDQQGHTLISVRLYLQWGITFLRWGVVYLNLPTLADWLSYDVLSMRREEQLGAAVAFFLYDTPKILMLLVLMVYAIAVVRADLNVQRVRSYLMERQRFAGYLLGASFGAVTPFCSCSSVPLFIGFTLGGIPLGVTMAFLITSPIINEVAVVLLWGILGWKMTLLYVVIGLSAGVIGGIVMDVIGARKWLQPYLLQAHDAQEGVAESRQDHHLSPMTLQQRHAYAIRETKAILRRVWVWVIMGVGVGALLHGFVPSDWILQHLAADNVWAVPGAVALGVPLYTNVTGIVPVMESLLLKGVSLGTTLAFCMSSVAVSFPELMMLKQVMRYELLAVFTATLITLFMVVGWLLNAFVAL